MAGEVRSQMGYAEAGPELRSRSCSRGIPKRAAASAKTHPEALCIARAEG